MTPTARSLVYARKQGLTVGIVERWIERAKRRIDLFGFADAVMLGPDGITALQFTSASNRAAHRDKILAEPRAAQWKDCGGRIELWTWGKAGAQGKRKLWTLHRERL